MSSYPIPHLPETAPFNVEQRAWLNGYLAGLLPSLLVPGTAAPTMSVPEAAPAPAGPRVPIFTSKSWSTTDRRIRLQSFRGHSGLKFWAGEPMKKVETAFRDRRAGNGHR